MSSNNEHSDERNFSQAFEQMCNFTAVAKTGNPIETAEGLVCLCFVVYPEGPYRNAADFQEVCSTLLGVRLEEHQFQAVLDSLLDRGVLGRPAATTFKLREDIRADVSARVKRASELETRIKDAWLSSVREACPELPVDVMWVSLRDYLCAAFRRHGMQVVALLDPSVETPSDQNRSLSSILDDVIDKNFELNLRRQARELVSNFLATAGYDSDRASYIVQLADGAFNFYTLKVAPDTINQLRSRLTDLTVFLDTNFLFGILDLHNNSQVDVSRELVRAISEHKLPIKLRYHEATYREACNTVSYYGSRLRAKHWPPALSRAAAKSHNVSGLELKYHERNSLSPVSAEDYLAPFDNFDVLLTGQGIAIYRHPLNRTQERADLYEEYQEYLAQHVKGDKPYDIINHDVTVLDTTRRLRSKAKSSMEARALFITCDYQLYRFDWESSRRDGSLACVLLPNMFWQILRPYISTDVDFEKSFAETFALPEFRTINSGAAKACSRMLGIMASWKDVPEETALTLLSNKVLLNQLQTVRDGVRFEELVEKAFIEQNATLAEENAALAMQADRERQRREVDDARRAEELKRKEEEANTLREELTQKERELERTRQVVESKAQVIADTNKETADARVVAFQKEEEAKREAQLRLNAEQNAFRLAVAAGLSLGMFLVVAFEAIVNALPWHWLVDHRNSGPLQIGFCLMLLMLPLGAFVRKWRYYCWGTGVVGVALVVLQISGR
jgi:hypothetical protein